MRVQAAIGIISLGLALSCAATAAPIDMFYTSEANMTPAPDAPDGWKKNMDGSYTQSDSNILCPVSFKNFSLRNIDGPSVVQPNILGVCHYADNEGRRGAIRIRRYPSGYDVDAQTAKNDKLLMSSDPPPVLMRNTTAKKTHDPRVVFTVARQGFLVDCGVSLSQHNKPRGDFPLYCTTIPNGN
jgi:hypothetical protein